METRQLALLAIVPAKDKESLTKLFEQTNAKQEASRTNFIMSCYWKAGMHLDDFIQNNYDRLQNRYEEVYPENVYDQDGEMLSRAFDSNHYLDWEVQEAMEVMEERYELRIQDQQEQAQHAKYEEYATE
jgi:hypothetical protein